MHDQLSDVVKAAGQQPDKANGLIDTCPAAAIPLTSGIAEIPGARAYLLIGQVEQEALLKSQPSRNPSEIKHDPALDALADDFERGDFELVPGTAESSPPPHSLPMGRPAEPRDIAATRRTVTEGSGRTTDVVRETER